MIAKVSDGFGLCSIKAYFMEVLMLLTQIVENVLRKVADTNIKYISEICQENLNYFLALQMLILL